MWVCEILTEYLRAILHRVSCFVINKLFANDSSFKMRCITVLAYKMKTIMSGRLEIVISRSNHNTRIRDYRGVIA